MKKIILKTIKAYQLAVSPLIKKITGSSVFCRYHPTCSDYSYQAVEKYGTIRGIILGTKRLLKCHPFSKGGEDPLR